MNVPGEAIRYIRMQSSPVAAVPSDQDAAARWSADTLAHWKSFLPHLPELSSGTVLEIGCGVGGFQVLLAQRYPGCVRLVLDGDGEVYNGGGFVKDCPPYNSRAVTDAVQSANNVTPAAWVPFGTKEVLEADLVISKASWGYHYPLSTYNVRSQVVIADLRKGLEPQRGLIIFDARKYRRCRFSLVA